MEMVARWPLEQHEKLFLPKNVCEILNIHPKVCLNCLSQRRYYAGGLLCWNMKRCYSIGGWCGLRRFADEAECAMKRPLVTLEVLSGGGVADIRNHYLFTLHLHSYTGQSQGQPSYFSMILNFYFFVKW